MVSDDDQNDFAPGQTIIISLRLKHNKADIIILIIFTSLIFIILTSASQTKIFDSRCISHSPKIRHVTCSLVSKLVTKLDNQVDAQSLVDAKDEAKYQNCTKYHHIYMLIIYDLRTQ